MLTPHRAEILKKRLNWLIERRAVLQQQIHDSSNYNTRKLLANNDRSIAELQELLGQYAKDKRATV